jgi:hypothetical protein
MIPKMPNEADLQCHNQAAIPTIAIAAGIPIHPSASKSKPLNRN